MKITNAAIGARIRQIREERGYTRERLAEYADVSSDFLWEVETGRKGVKAEKLGRLAVALNISADYLLFGTENVDVNSMLAALPNEMQQQVAKMITVFVDTVQISTNNILEKKKADDKQGD